MSARHYAIRHGLNRIRSSHGNPVGITAGTVYMTIQNRSAYADNLPKEISGHPSSTPIVIPVAYLDGADYTCISVSSGTVSRDGITVALGMSDFTLAVTDCKVKVEAVNLFSQGISAITPASQFVPVNSVAEFTVQFNPGYSASDVNVSAGTLSGTSWAVPVGDSPLSAAITERSQILVSVDNQFTEGVASLNPMSQNVPENSTASVAVQYKAGYSDADVDVSVGTLSGSLWSIPVASSDVNAVIRQHDSRQKIHVGDNDYPYVQIGGLLWTAANLAEPIPGASGNGVYRWAHNETDNTKGYGMLYGINSIYSDTGGRRTALEALFPAGWRIPTNADFEDLKSHCSSYRDLMRADKGGNDRYGFAGLDTGQAYTRGGDCFEFTTFQLHTLGTYDTFVVSHSSSSYRLQFHNNGSSRMIAIRLCKDA